MGTRLVVIAVEKPLYRLSQKYSALYNLAAVLRLHMHVLIIIRLYSHQRAQFTKSLAPGFYHAQMRDILLHFHLYAVNIFTEFYHFVVNFLGAGGHTSGTGTDKHAAGIVVYIILNLSLSAQQIIF